MEENSLSVQKKEKIPIRERSFGKIMRVVTFLYTIIAFGTVIISKYIIPELSEYINSDMRAVLIFSAIGTLSMYLFIFQKDADEYRERWLDSMGRKPSIIILKTIGMFLFIIVVLFVFKPSQ